MINVGLVGFGLSGRFLQAPFFMSNRNFVLKSLVTSQEIPKYIFPDTKKAESLDELINDPEIHLISIASPNPTHYEYAKKCLLAGKHILLEKPMTSTAAEARDLIEIAKSKGLVMCVFQNRRFDGDFMTVKKVIESGVLGEILSYEAHFDRFKPILNPKKWKETVAPGSGVLYDLGSHLIDQAIYLFGKPEGAEGEVFIERAGSEIDDAFDLRLNYKNLRVTLKSSLMIKEQVPKYVVNGTKGSFIKYGLDVQEDQLKAGMTPDQEGFGKEESQFDGHLRTEIGGLEYYGRVETIAGEWNQLYDNLAFVIYGKNELIIQPEQILTQIEVIEQIKSKVS
ncbi:Gfo/Idh/MocA family oxidoreductase [Emticicia sp. CRIBPO]|uniref:Gfo/Idh/MocA family oxidoreductase n=1 Tax=Emticicia sp. CRIBPO TaxID=2683258 RepID=UPI001412F686|nr:Gfo/Idh/MocA family oxidoreductase [Emticicia sp. CRIBPO]NBA87683.1 Gfo/Idh/MocA family oxidoreductase [Emticicia sp. CRIBPO]